MDIFSDMNEYSVMPSTTYPEQYDDVGALIEGDVQTDMVSYGTSTVDYGGQPSYGNQQHQYYEQKDFKTDEVQEEIEDYVEQEDPAEIALKQEEQDFLSKKPTITISNVVCNYRCRTHLDLRNIALSTKHVIYKRDQGKVMMKIRKPNMMANIWSSGKIVCQGARSEEEAKKGARRIARILYKVDPGKNVRVSNYKVVNVLGNCKLAFAVDIMEFSKENAGPHCSYEPELHPAVTYRPANGTTTKIFSTGALTLLGRNVALVNEALDLIYPLLFKHRKTRTEFDVDCKDEDEEEDEF